MCLHNLTSNGFIKVASSKVKPGVPSWAPVVGRLLVCLLLVGFYLAEVEAAQASGSNRLPGGSGAFSWSGPNGQRLPFGTPEEVEEFLRTAEPVAVEETPEGINRPWKVLLEKDGIRMNACFRSVRVHKRRVRLKSGKVIRDFRDDAIFECAAYKISRLLGLTNVPPTVSRKVKGKRGTIQAWIEGGILEKERRARGSQAPDRQSWLCQIQTLRLFDNLIFNEDRNSGNMIIGGDWKLWMIDHTRSFRSSEVLLNPSIVRSCNRRVWESLQGLTEEALRRELDGLLQRRQIKALLGRRDLLVEHVKNLIDKYGEEEVLFGPVIGSQ